MNVRLYHVYYTCFRVKPYPSDVEKNPSFKSQINESFPLHPKQKIQMHLVKQSSLSQIVSNTKGKRDITGTVSYKYLIDL